MKLVTDQSILDKPAKAIWAKVVKAPESLKSLFRFQDFSKVNGEVTFFVNKLGFDVRVQKPHRPPVLIEDHENSLYIRDIYGIGDLPTGVLYMFQIHIVSEEQVLKIIDGQIGQAGWAERITASNNYQTEIELEKARVKLYPDYLIASCLKEQKDTIVQDIKQGNFRNPTKKGRSLCILECFVLADENDFILEKRNHIHSTIPKGGNVFDKRFGILITPSPKGYNAPEIVMPDHPYSHGYNIDHYEAKVIMQNTQTEPKDLVVCYRYTSSTDKDPKWIKLETGEVQPIYPIKCSDGEEAKIVIRTMLYDKNNPAKPIILTKEILASDQFENHGFYRTKDRAETEGDKDDKNLSEIGKLKEIIKKQTEKIEDLDRKLAQAQSELGQKDARINDLHGNIQDLRNNRDDKTRQQRTEQKYEHETVMEKIKRNGALLGVVSAVAGAIGAVIKHLFSAKKAFAALRAFTFL